MCALTASGPKLAATQRCCAHQCNLLDSLITTELPARRLQLDALHCWPLASRLPAPGAMRPATRITPSHVLRRPAPGRRCSSGAPGLSPGGVVQKVHVDAARGQLRAGTRAARQREGQRRLRIAASRAGAAEQAGHGHGCSSDARELFAVQQRPQQWGAAQALPQAHAGLRTGACSCSPQAGCCPPARSAPPSRG